MNEHIKQWDYEERFSDCWLREIDISLQSKCDKFSFFYLWKAIKNAWLCVQLRADLSFQSLARQRENVRKIHKFLSPLPRFQDAFHKKHWEDFYLQAKSLFVSNAQLFFPFTWKYSCHSLFAFVCSWGNQLWREIDEIWMSRWYKTFLYFLNIVRKIISK